MLTAARIHIKRLPSGNTSGLRCSVMSYVLGLGGGERETGIIGWGLNPGCGKKDVFF
uniref:Uncharacterized protein n=1 Tax=Arundo donax TaxID=35708 RepID=A0A0A9AZW2_ARUDO